MDPSPRPNGVQPGGLGRGARGAPTALLVPIDNIDLLHSNASASIISITPFVIRNS